MEVGLGGRREYQYHHQEQRGQQVLGKEGWVGGSMEGRGAGMQYHAQYQQQQPHQQQQQQYYHHQKRHHHHHQSEYARGREEECE